MIKRLFLLTVLIASAQCVFSQNLDKMDKAKREAYLFAKTKEYTMRYGPDYYREYKAPIFNRANMPEYGCPTGKNKNRAFYSVRIPYDMDKELFFNNDAVYVRIWADTGEVGSITFGNRTTYLFEKEDGDNHLKSTEDYPVAPYRVVTGAELEALKQRAKLKIRIITSEGVKEK